MISIVFGLLVVYQIKHWLADYPFQTAFMLGKFKSGWDFLIPLSSHCAIHALFTFAISVAYGAAMNNSHFGRTALYLSAFDFVAHFIMDRVKASPKLLGRFKALSATEYKTIATEIESFTSDLINCNDEDFESDKVFDKFQKNHSKLKNNTYFWWCLGIDQMWHHLTHYTIIWFLINN